MTATAQEKTDKTFTIDYNERTRIIITRYGVAQTSERRLYSYETIRYSYHVERTTDGKLTRTDEYTGYKGHSYRRKSQVKFLSQMLVMSRYYIALLGY